MPTYNVRVKVKGRSTTRRITGTDVDDAIRKGSEIGSVREVAQVLAVVVFDEKLTKLTD